MHILKDDNITIREKKLRGEGSAESVDEANEKSATSLAVDEGSSSLNFVVVFNIGITELRQSVSP